MRHRSVLVRKSLMTFILIAPILIYVFGCGPHLPPPSSPDYAAIVSAFTIGTIALETEDPDHQLTYLTKVTTLAPDEPAGWANLGVLQLRNNQLAEAANSLNKAKDLAPSTAGIEKLLGLLADRNGNLPEAIAHYKKAIELAPDDLRARYSVAQLEDRQSTPEGDAAYQSAMQAILDKQPYNLVAQIELARIAAKRADAATLQKAIALLDARSSTFAADAQSRLKDIRDATAKGEMQKAAIDTQFLANVLKQNIAYAPSSNALAKPSTEKPGDPIKQFIKLAPMPAACSAPDMALNFTSAPLMSKGDAGKFGWAGAIWLDEKGSLALLESDGRKVRFDNGAELPFPGGPKALPPGPHGVLPIEMNYDLKNDLVFAGNGGIKFFLQTGEGTFTDVTAKSALPAPILGGAYTGAWAVDIEADGDLDVVLGSEGGTPTVLRDNGDGTWTPIHPFAEVTGLRDFAWADLDRDGNPDAALIDGEGKLHIFANLRAGLFRERTLPASIGKSAALAVADVNNDGKMDVLALQADGGIVRISDKSQGTDFDTAEIGRWANPPDDLKAGTARLMVGDLDNNGSMDLVASTDKGAQVWLSNDKGAFASLSTPVPAGVFAVADLDKDGRLDLIGLSSDGQPVRLNNKGSLNYAWQEMRPRANDAEVIQRDAKKPTGDHRVNSFGIGGEIEVRAGLLYEKQAMTGPVIHVGLGSYPAMDAARVIWPNGDVRSEFGDKIKVNSSVEVLHRLTGSCPWVFAWNGKEMGFVTDFIWRSPVGLRINAQDTAGMAQTEDWIKIRGDQLVPRDGYYDVRITAELWETHFFDTVRLMTVDHPANTDIFVDERFSIPPPKLAVHTLTPPKPVIRAVDDNGTDVTEIVRARDEKYLDNFGRGIYQGITRDHFVEVELGEDARKAESLYLVASGWIHPTDSSINVAISQGKHDPPSSLSLEVPDGKGGWRVARTKLGFPAGKEKTILIRLDDVLPRKNANQKLSVRLRTNLELYWDSLAYASELPDARLKTERLAPQTAELRYRGYSVVNQADSSSPELPDYQHLAGSGQRWRDLIGYCTRFGDVRELLDKVDDRYVIMNAGDEMALRFAAPPPPPTGWKRDFVLIGDGWEKDGNFNTVFSKTILPLPFHGQKRYDTPPGRLEDDPVVRQHPQDWQTYHTRYITPQAFNDALLPGK